MSSYEKSTRDDDEEEKMNRSKKLSNASEEEDFADEDVSQEDKEKQEGADSNVRNQAEQQATSHTETRVVPKRRLSNFLHMGGTRRIRSEFKRRAESDRLMRNSFQSSSNATGRSTRVSFPFVGMGGSTHPSFENTQRCGSNEERRNASSEEFSTENQARDEEKKEEEKKDEETE